MCDHQFVRTILQPCYMDGNYMGKAYFHLCSKCGKPRDVYNLELAIEGLVMELKTLDYVQAKNHDKEAKSRE